MISVVNLMPDLTMYFGVQKVKHVLTDQITHHIKFHLL